MCRRFCMQTAYAYRHSSGKKKDKTFPVYYKTLDSTSTQYSDNKSFFISVLPFKWYTCVYKQPTVSECFHSFLQEYIYVVSGYCARWRFDKLVLHASNSLSTRNARNDIRIGNPVCGTAAVVCIYVWLRGSIPVDLTIIMIIIHYVLFMYTSYIIS